MLFFTTYKKREIFAQKRKFLRKKAIFFENSAQNGCKKFSRFFGQKKGGDVPPSLVAVIYFCENQSLWYSHRVAERLG